MNNLVPISSTDFSKKIICDGHLFYPSLMKGKKIYLMRPGALIDEDFRKKYSRKKIIFEIEIVVDNDITNKFEKLFKELKEINFEKDLRLKCQEIIYYFKEVYGSDNHFLSFAQVVFREFCSISTDDLIRINETDVNLFRKALYSAAFSLVISISNDFYHYDLIKDLYNLTFGLDIGLCSKEYSYYVACACNEENLNPGRGLEWLRNNNVSQAEIDTYLQHPEESYKFFQQNLSLFTYKDLIEVSLFQHELSSGCGFPRGIPKGQVSSWEAVVILATVLVNIQDDYEFERKVIEYLLNFKKNKFNDLPVERSYKKLCLIFGNIFVDKERIG